MIERLRYFIAAAVCNLVVHLFHQMGPIVLRVSVGLNLVICALMYCLMPLLDALPYKPGKLYCRAGTLAVVAVEVTTFIRMRFYPEWFYENYHVVDFKQHGASGRDYIVISSLGVQSACSAILVVLALRISIASFRFPNRAHILMHPIWLEGLHRPHLTPDGRQYIDCLLVRLLGVSRGNVLFKAIERVFFRFALFSAVVAIANKCVDLFASESAAAAPLQLAAAVIWVILVAMAILVMNIDVLARCRESVVVWYLSICALLAGAGSMWLYGARQSWSAVFVTYSITWPLVPIVWPLVDCLPIALHRSVTRSITLAMVVVFGTNAVFLHINVLSLNEKETIAAVYRDRGSEVISNLELVQKTSIVIALLSINTCYRAWVWPGFAAVLFHMPSYAVLHARPVGRNCRLRLLVHRTMDVLKRLQKTVQASPAPAPAMKLVKWNSTVTLLEINATLTSPQPDRRSFGRRVSSLLMGTPHRLHAPGAFKLRQAPGLPSPGAPSRGMQGRRVGMFRRSSRTKSLVGSKSLTRSAMSDRGLRSLLSNLSTRAPQPAAASTIDAAAPRASPAELAAASTTDSAAPRPSHTDVRRVVVRD